MRTSRGLTLTEIGVLIVLLGATAAVIVTLTPQGSTSQAHQAYGPRFDAIEKRIEELQRLAEDLEQSPGDEAAVRELKELRAELEPLIWMASQMQQEIEDTGGREKYVERQNVTEHVAAKVDCMNNVRYITDLLNITLPDKYPNYSGANLILYLVAKGEISTRSGDLKTFFCPGDKLESIEKAGGIKALREMQLDQQGINGHLTSYAGRDLRKHPTKPSSRQAVVLVAGDSPDHHDGKGIVVGLSVSGKRSPAWTCSSPSSARRWRRPASTT